MDSIKQIANEARQYFERRERDNGDKFWCFDDSLEVPAWLKDAVYEAHEGMLPDDYKYRFFVEALDGFADYDDPETFLEEIQADSSTWDAIQWLGSNMTRQWFTDRALEEGANTTSDVLRIGQEIEKTDVAYIVLRALESQLEEITHGV